MTVKKLLCLALGMIMLVSCGCGGSNESSVIDNSGVESKEESDASENVVHTEYTKAIDALLSGTSDRTLNKKNLLKGLSYETSVSPSAEYPDNKNILTDGTIPDSFNANENWVGYMFRSMGKNIITFDLGSVKGGLLDFSLVSLDHVDYGINAPVKVIVSVAGNDKKYTEVGTAYRSEGTLPQNGALDYRVRLHKAVEARYIKFEVVAPKSWLFIGEVSAVSYDASYEVSDSIDGDINAYYGYSGIPEISKPEYWSESENNYKTEINLIKSKKPYISAGEPAEMMHITEWYNGTDTQKLTDGIKSTKASYADAPWFHITGGFSRSITYDLEKTSAVKGFSIGFLRDVSAGVEMPTDLLVLISENGKDWQTVYYNEIVSTEKDYDIVRVEASLDKTYKARYVKIDFCVYPHVYIDEITVTGTKDVSGAADVVPDEENVNDAGKNYLMPEDFFGVNNMLLSYHCQLGENNISTDDGRADVDEYLPYIAYLDEQGNIKDTFFDSVLYLPYVNMIHDKEKSVFGRSAEGWKNYVDDMFYPDRNMNALEKCADKVYSELGITDQKIKVFTSVIYTFPKLMDGSKNPFGDIDGDGRSEDFSKIEDRKKAIKWIMDEEYKRFNEGGYKHLEFCGFYWFEESIDYSDPHEKELIKYAVDYAHTLGCKVFWIPYRTAMGVNDWEDLGFDAACLQPNYMFTNNGSVSALYNTAARAKRLGMCVELEISGPQYPSAARKFIEYLNAGAQTGFMKAVKMYYQDGVPGAFHTACYSEEASVRRIYDWTYLFAKEKYVPILAETSVLSETPLEFKYKKNRTLTAKLDVSHLDLTFGELVVMTSPKYGDLKLNRDGSFVYYPAEDFNGEDSFEIAFDVGYGEPVPVRITVKCE